MRCVVFFLAATLGAAIPLRGEFESRYPKLKGYAHHIYVEGFDMPVLNAGPSDPAASPDGVLLAATLPDGPHAQMLLLDVNGGAAVELVHGARRPLMPAFGADGQSPFTWKRTPVSAST